MFKIIIIVFLILFASWSVVYAQQSTLLTDFEGTGNQLLEPFGGYFYGYTDNNEVPPGSSTIEELIIKGENSILNPIVKRNFGADKSAGYLKISGAVTIQFKYGYAGCGFNFKSDASNIDLSKYKGIKFDAKGSEHFFLIKLNISDILESERTGDWAFHEKAFMPDENWGKKTIFFKDLKQPSFRKKKVKVEEALKKVKGIQWQTKGQPIDKYELCLDNIELIQ